MLVVHRRCDPLMDSPAPQAREVQGASKVCAPFGVHDAVIWALFPTLAQCVADAVDQIQTRCQRPPLV